MKIVTVRRICQVFFLLVFLWFCVASTLGDAWWQLRGWPVNWFLQLDPLVGLGVLLTTHTIYKGLLWGLVTVVLTILLGRFFCGWVCPLGAVNQFVGFIGRLKKSIVKKADSNRYHKAQAIKYWLLIFLLASGAAELVFLLIRWPRDEMFIFWIALLLILIGTIGLALLKVVAKPKKTLIWLLALAGTWSVLSLVWGETRGLFASLQTGLLDPLPLFYRSVNLALLPIIDGTVVNLSVSSRFYEGAWFIGSIFISIVFLNLKVPRFYCRFICPLGALFGVLVRFSIWRIGKTKDMCRLQCHLCETNCEGACEPSDRIRSSECVLCMNCRDDCFSNLMAYQVKPSVSGEILSPDLSRREFVVSLLSGAGVVATTRLSGSVGPNWNPALIRPPGALDEKAFLRRCIKCGQCMRVCPTNVIQPDIFRSGLEGLWTPALNFRLGTSGCQYNCIACGNICPTSAIRPIRPEERLGLKAFTRAGPIRIGTAFVDRGRCLPWAMDKPCIVCQENCPVSPKAIFTREYFSRLRSFSDLKIKKADSLSIAFDKGALDPGRFATGDFYCHIQALPEAPPRPIIKNTDSVLRIASTLPWKTPPSRGSRVAILIRLQQPYVDLEHCIGCGVCEHECPVKGKRAIRVTAENESRNREHALLLTSGLKK